MKEFFIQQYEFWLNLWDRLTSVWGFLLFIFLLLLGFIENQLGGFTFFTALLFRLQLSDLIIGIYAALTGRGKRHSTFKSVVGRDGVNRKFWAWCYIWAAHQFDLMWGTNLAEFFIKAYATFELSSLLENWVALKWYGHKSLEKLLVLRLQNTKKLLTKWGAGRE